jgi:hypothetical protein
MNIKHFSQDVPYKGRKIIESLFYNRVKIGMFRELFFLPNFDIFYKFLKYGSVKKRNIHISVFSLQALDLEVSNSFYPFLGAF